MRYGVFILWMLAAQPGFTELYKCAADSKITYQDKPCQAAQTQTVLAMVVSPVQKPPSVSVAGGLNSAKTDIVRDRHGKIKRSQKAKNAFKAGHPCPANNKRSGACPGYVIDHIQPLACGGVDSPENMQWQTIAAGKAKDRWERKGC